MTQPDPTQPTVTSSSTPPEQPVAQQTPEVKPGDVKALPQWAQDIISSVRAEAANWRTQLREAQDALSKAKSPEDIAKATEEMAAKNAALERDLLVERIANKHSLPADLKDALKGETEADLEKHATALAKYAPKAQQAEVIDPDTLAGGVNPGGDSTEGFDPVALADSLRKNRY